MGKAGRIACIFTPMALTIASFVCLILVEVSGWNGNLSSYYFFQANLTDITIPADASNAALNTAVQSVEQSLSNIYQIHLWNYCYSGIDHKGQAASTCSGRESEFVFDPIDVWNLNVSDSSSSSSSGVVQSAVDAVKNSESQLEEELLGKSAKDALTAYRTAAKWMWIAYQVSFWSTLVTILVGILAIFSRWGSVLTWILSFISTLFTFGAVLTSTVLFSLLVGALNEALKQYDITLQLGERVLVTNWLGVAFSLSATFFWLFSCCCCSGRSNPHHRSNKGGLWRAEPKGQGYGYAGSDARKGGPLSVEKTGGSGYQRVASPYVGGGDAHHSRDMSDQLPLHDYAQPAPWSPSPPQQRHYQGAGYEPFRHA